MIATYNRAEILRETLTNMAQLDRQGVRVEFVIIDNNSSDATSEVVESFAGKLPVRYLFEPRPGKNCALNKALNEVNLSRLVVFTDDDVQPQADWLKAVISISERWPDYSAFGGKVHQIMPEMSVPYWDEIRRVLPYGEQDYADSECDYRQGHCPLGVNFWVRREIFDAGRRYNESLGPHPTNRINGSESSFLLQLRADGYKILYSPRAVVGHFIQPEILTPSAFRKRAWEWGRGQAHAQELPYQAILRKHPLLWRMLRAGSLFKGLLYYARVKLHLSCEKRLIGELRAIARIGCNIELFRIERDKQIV